MSIKGIRRAIMEDVAEIKKLKNPITDAFFGQVKISNIIEHSYLSLCLYDIKDKIIAFMSLDTSPNVPAIPSWDWLPWIQNLYLIKNLTARNTLFIIFMAWKVDFCAEFIPIILRTTFYSYLHVQNIILVGPPEVPDVFFIQEQFSRILPNGYKNASRVQTIFITLRQRFVTRYKIRRAVEEDNDDIVPLIDDHACSLKDLYGEFYVAEIIQALEDPQSESARDRQFIVAESNGIAVGVLCLTSVINYEILNQCFELKPFNGLKKPNSLDVSIVGSFGPDFHDDMEQFRELVGSKMSLDIESVRHSRSIMQLLEEIQSRSPSFHHQAILPAEIDADVEEESEDLDSADSFTIIDSLPSYNTDWQIETEDAMNEIATSEIKSIFSYILLTSGSLKSKEEGSTAPSDNPSSLTIQTNLPRYFGEDNAFAIELFATDSANERAITPDLIEAAFECYPSFEYCILTVPSTYPPCPLLQPFVKVPPRSVTTYPHELYVLHRNSLFGELNVRLANMEDLLPIRNLVNGIRKEEQIFMDITQAVLIQNGSQEAYVLTSENSVVGCIVIGEEEEYDYIAAHYTVKDYLHLEHYPIGSFGLIVHAIISPIFQTHKRYFFSEVHRLSDLLALHYCLHPTDSNHRILGNIVSEMIPVEPRSRPEYKPNWEKDGDVCRDFILRQNSPYSLYVMNSRLCSVPKMDVNYKIVVVGASTTGISFLENLIFGQTASYISFTNVTLVSVHGFNYIKTPNKSRDLFFPYEGRYNYQHMIQIALHCYVNLVTGAMTSINRKEKFILVDHEKVIPYDFLYLTCGEQYHPPSILKLENSELIPENLYVINTEYDAHTALLLLKPLVDKHKNYTIIVYGASLEAHCCLSALRAFGISGKHIIFVEPYPLLEEPNHQVSLFNDGEVDEAVSEAIGREGIRVYTTYYFKNWEYNESSNRIQSVIFESKFKLLNIPCIAMFYYGYKTVTQTNITAITEAGGMVYDGRLVINPMFQSNDPCIFAAGSMTKYSRRYYANNLCQKYFNHVEVGQRLALYAKKAMDPTYNMENKTPSETDLKTSLTPVFSKPFIRYCTLPGKLNYLYITKPGKPLSIEAQMNKEDYGRVLITGTVKNRSPGYFRLHLNQNNFIETITCLTKNPIDVHNMVKLWGKHERLLNKLVQRFEMFLIQDLYEYFRQPWVYAIFHESFEDEVEKVNQLILNGVRADCDTTIVTKIIDLLEKNEWKDLTQEQRAEIVELYEKSEHKTKIEENLLQFLLTYDMHLPVYAHPLKAKLILQGFENSPLHFPQ